MKNYELRPEHNADNVLKLDNPDQYECVVWRYTVGHSMLTIVLREKNTQEIASYYLMLDVVRKYEGEMSWHGANFRTATQQDCINYLINWGLDEKKAVWESIFYRLYLIDTSHSQIKILSANRINVTTDIRQYRQNHDDRLLDRIVLDKQSGKFCIPKVERGINLEGREWEHHYSVWIESILEDLEAGYSHKDILAVRPNLEPEDIQAALIYARRAISKPSDKPTE